MPQIKRLLAHPLFPWVLFSLAALLIGLLNANSRPKKFEGFPGEYTHYNNYLIFKNSSANLLENRDLYAAYPEKQYDLFKYSPSFALLFAPLAWMPDWLGLSLWNLLNIAVLLIGIRGLKFLQPWQQGLFALLLLQETITSTLNSQSNVLIAGLLLIAFNTLEAGRRWAPLLCIWLTAFIKIFGGLFFFMLLLYPKWWRYILPGLAVFLGLLTLPLLLIEPADLWMQYQSYFHLLANDHSQFIKYSFASWLQAWTGWLPPKVALLTIGLLVQLLPLLRLKNFAHAEFRRVYAASWLIWVVIFNHMAESATFVIAVTGVLLWFFAHARKNKWQLAALAMVIVFTCFGPSDLFPAPARKFLMQDLQMKVFPCILVWGICIWELTVQILYMKGNKNS